MPLIGARLGNDVDHRSSVPAIFRIKCVGNHAKFLGRVRDEVDYRLVGKGAVAVGAVHHEVVHHQAAATAGKNHGWVRTGGNPINRIVGVGIAGNSNAGQQANELVKIAAVEGKIHDGLGVDYGAYLGR